MQPHSKLGLVVGMIRGLKLGLSVDASVGIVMGTGTSDKAPLEEAVVGAALELQTEHNCAAQSMQPHSKLGLVVGTILGLKLGLSVGALVDIVLGTGTSSDKAQLEEAVVGAALGIADGAQLSCSVDATTLKARTRRGYDTRTKTGTPCGVLCWAQAPQTKHHWKKPP